MMYPPLTNVDNTSFDFASLADRSTLTPSPLNLPDNFSHMRLPVDYIAWPNPSARSNIATSSPTALPAAGPREHSITFPDPWTGKAREDGDAPWRGSPSVDAPGNGVDTVSAAFLQLLEAHKCGANPKVVSLLRLLLCNHYLSQEELLDLVDWRGLAAIASHVLRCAASRMPSITSSRRLKLDHSLTTNATTTLSDFDGVYHSAEFLHPADTTPRTAISDYELHGMQPSSFLNDPASPAFPSGALGIATASSPSTISPALLIPPPTILLHPSGPEPPPETPFDWPEPRTEPAELHHSESPGHQQPASLDASTAQKRRCLDCQVEHTKQWRKHPEHPGYLCNACGQHQAKHKSPRSHLTIRRERARANE
ncbi:hypothetical protein B0H11DRAFT_2230742 [Mycena galericulata]|nr:hypothetical protein B0H11DRAFT_2230742 [Mycena galericulata]